MEDDVLGGAPIRLLPDLDIDEEVDDRTGGNGPWIVILYNDDWHPIEEVVLQVEKATGCSEAHALRVTVEAHTRGRSIAMTGSREDCERAAAILRQIRLQVETDAF